MINTILGTIASVVEKDFLFAAFLPAIIFLTAVAGTFGMVIGAEPLLAVIESTSAARLLWASTATVIGLIVMAYVLRAMVGHFTRAWSGDTALLRTVLWGWSEIGKEFQRRRYERLRRESTQVSRWSDVLHHFESQARIYWAVRPQNPSWWRRFLFGFRIYRLHPQMSKEIAIERVTTLARMFDDVNGNALTVEYGNIKRRLLDWHEQDSYKFQACSASLDRGYGALAAVKPTRLGNVIESYNYYAFTRFSMEAELIWPRLEHVIPEPFSRKIRDAKVLLDFMVTLSTLALVYAGLALFIGPWLLNVPVTWSIVAAISVLVAVFFYRLSIDVAIQYGDGIRAAIDLFRLDLLQKLGFGRPATLNDERALWRKYSQLIVYSSAVQIDIAPLPSQ